MINKVISYVGIFFLYILSILPMNLLYVFAILIYWLLYYVFGYRKVVVRKNLMMAFPEKSLAEIIIIEKRFFKYLARVMFEIVKMATISKSALKKRYVCKNVDRITAYTDMGESVLVCSAHYGNWEWGTMALGLNIGVPIYPIYKPLSNKVFDKWFYHIRTRFGNKMIAMKQTYRALNETKDLTTIFCFGNDQAPPKNESHYWIDFLNHRTSIQLGIEKIAKKTNRPVFYIKVNVIKRGYYEIDCVPLVLDPSKTTGHEITDLHARFLEQLIKEDPAYWLWSHRRWKHMPIPLPADEVI